MIFFYLFIYYPLSIDVENTGIYEPRHEKSGFFHMRKQRRKSTAKLISAFVFATRMVQPLCSLHPKFQASSHILLWLYSPVCVGSGRKPRKPVFSQRGSFYSITTYIENGKICHPVCFILARTVIVQLNQTSVI